MARLQRTAKHELPSKDAFTVLGVEVLEKRSVEPTRWLVAEFGAVHD